jgi:hypothetical protein
MVGKQCLFVVIRENAECDDNASDHTNRGGSHRFERFVHLFRFLLPVESPCGIKDKHAFQNGQPQFADNQQEGQHQ